MLTGKNIILGVSGSIAAYKAVYLARLLLSAGASVRPMLTQAATRFIGPLTFSAITGQRAVTDMWSAADAGEIGHVEYAHSGDALVLAPASANLIARLAQGRADDPITAVALATRMPWVVAPAMEEGMWLNTVTQDNVQALRQRGARIVLPGTGALASGRSGVGRMAEPEEIFETTLGVLTTQDLAGKRVVVSAGPTREALDPARFLSNASSGKMGYALARAARRRGASVVLVSGPTMLAPPFGVELMRVETTVDMLTACLDAIQDASVLIMAAAPADFRPVTALPHKHKKRAGERLQLELENTPDILRSLKPRPPGLVVVGFAAESDDMIANAKKKLTAKELDLIVANDITRVDAGFAADTNAVTLISRDGEPDTLPLMSKDDVAMVILDRVVARLESP